MINYNDSIEKSKHSLLVGGSPRRWICEVHREIYDIIDNEISDNDKKEQTFNLLAEAYWMGKKMSDRLLEFKVDLSKTSQGRNADLESDLSKRAERLNLLKNIYCVNIDTINWCNRKCDWCPNKFLDKTPDMKMSPEIFQRIIRQLRDYGYKGQIHPYLFGEPFADDRILKFCEHIKLVLPDTFIRITTNGDYLQTTGDIDVVFEAGVDSLLVDHYDGKFKDIRKARDKDYSKLTHFGLNYLKETFYNRAHGIDCTPIDSMRECKCSLFMGKLNFDYKGNLILCCSDFKSEVIFGNIMEQPLSMIMGSDLYKKYYYVHKEKKGYELPVCERCNHIWGKNENPTGNTGKVSMG